MAFFAHFKALPYKCFTNNSLKKLTRKRQELDLQCEYFPAQGQVCVKQNDTKYLFFGGGDINESTWANADKVFQLDVNVDFDDINIQTFKQISLSGSVFPPLHASAACNVGNIILIWGGLNLNQYQTTNELIFLKMKDCKSASAKVEIVQDYDGISQRKMENNPISRCGHTLNKVEEKIILHGGMTINFPFTQDINDNNFYVLDFHTLKWRVIDNLPEVPVRAFHTSEVTMLNGVSSVLYLGGIQSSSKDSVRLNLLDILSLRVLHDTFEVDFITLSNSIPCPLSYHSCVYLEPFLIIIGGYSEGSVSSNKLHQINLIDRSSTIIELDEQFCTAGHSSVKLDDQCILVCGGTNKQYFTYSSKKMAPSVCDLGTQCKISETNELSPISWVYCEGGCKSWYHQFCEGILGKRLKGKYKCRMCSAKKKKA